MQTKVRCSYNGECHGGPYPINHTTIVFVPLNCQYFSRSFQYCTTFLSHITIYRDHKRCKRLSLRLNSCHVFIFFLLFCRTNDMINRMVTVRLSIILTVNIIDYICMVCLCGIWYSTLSIKYLVVKVLDGSMLEDTSLMK